MMPEYKLNPRMTSYLLLVSLLTLLLWSAGCGHEPAEEESSDSASKGESGVIVLTEKQADSLDVALFQVTRDFFHFNLPLPGIVMPAPGHELVISAPIDGRISKLHVREGNRVEIGDVLVEIESLTIGNLAADYIQARADAVYQDQQLARLEKLQEKGVGSLRELEKTRAERQRAEASLSAAQSRLRAIGFVDADLKNWDAVGAIDPKLTLRATIAGLVSKASLALGQAVDSNERLMVVIDPTHVLVRAFLSPQDLPLVKIDGSVTIHPNEEAGSGISGTIDTINPTLDDINRAATVNSQFPTTNGWPVPGQSLRVQVSAVTPKKVLEVPLSAVVFEGESAVVYVASGDNRYEKRRIKISRMTATGAIILDGLAEGEKVAMSSVFDLKALGRLDQFGGE